MNTLLRPHRRKRLAVAFPAVSARPARAITIGLLAWIAAAGCKAPVGGTPVAIWAVDDIHPAQEVTLHTGEAELFDPVLHRLTLAGAIDETLGFHLALSTTEAQIPELDVVPGDFVSGDARIPASTVQVYRLHTVRIERWPGWHIRMIEPQRRMPDVPDVVVPASAPIGGLPVTLPAGETLRLWIDVLIPAGTAPGSYRGELLVRSRQTPIDRIPVTLTVWPFLLPAVSDLALVAEVDPQSLAAHHIRFEGRAFAPERIPSDHPRQAQFDDLLTHAFRLLEGHKVWPVLRRLHPVVKIDAARQVVVSWDDYDRVVEGFLDGSRFFDRRPCPVWPIPFDETFPPPTGPNPLASPTHANVVRQYLRQCAEHFDQHGWLDRTYLVLPYAERPEPRAFQAVRHFGAIVRDADPRLSTLCHLFPQDMSSYGWVNYPYEDVTPQVDIWCPPAQFYDPSTLPSRVGKPAEMWYQIDRPPFSGSIHVAAPPTYTRVIPWQGRRLGARVIALGLANDPLPQDKMLTPQQCIQRNDSLLIYPGTAFGLSEPVASMRLKRLRRGMQDLAFVELAETLNLSHVSQTIMETLCPFAAAEAYGAHFADGRAGAWIEDPQWWRVARRVLADHLVRSVEGDSDAGSDAVAPVIRWRRLMDATRTVDVTVNGVHVRPAGAKPEDGALVEASTTVANHTRVPLSGVAGFGDLPIGWTAEPARLTLPAITPGDAARLTLTARADAITWDPGGMRYLPAVFETADRGTHRLAIRMAYVFAQRLQDPPSIDGDISDWPVGLGSVASDYLLVTGEPPDAGDTGSGRPSAPTRCLVGRDAENLYFGFRCAAEGTPDLTHRSNSVTYEDMIPVGEELVEVLIDPDASATHSPGDLYHVVVKLAGATWERGIGTYPPTGRRRVWPADIRHATRWHGDHWEAEVAIPFAAFGRPAPENEVWGVNFTRFDVFRQEYSNWSGAVSNVYDPMALGNLGL